MNLKYLFCIFMLAMPGGISYSQESRQSNLRIIDKLIDESFTPVNNKLLILGKDNFYELVLDGNNEVNSYLLSGIKRKFYDYKLIFNEDSDSIDYKLIFTKPVFKVRYKKIFTDNVLGTKKVTREVSASYNIELVDRKNSSVIYNQNFSKKISDTFDLDKLGSIEDSRYVFSHAELPEESTINQILFPSIIITVSAAAIILFFIIRSK